MEIRSVVLYIVIIVITSVGSMCSAAASLSSTENSLQDITIRIKTVTFTGEAFYNVAIDCPSRYCNDYATPHWLDSNEDGDAQDPGDNQFPVAFTRNTVPSVTDLTFAVIPASFEASNVEVLGVGSGGEMYFGYGDVANGLLVVPGTLEADLPLPDAVTCFDTYDIQWQVTLDGYGSRPAGISSNRMYVTFQDPIGARLESYFDISTRAAAGCTEEQQTIDWIWDEFTDLEVYNVRGERLAYYRGVLCASYCSWYSAYELVYHTTSQCGGWADLMMQCLNTQGIGYSEFVTIEPRNVPDPPLDCQNTPRRASGIVVADYGLAPAYAPNSGCETYRYRFNDPCNIYRKWSLVDTWDVTGLPGQDNPNPASWFARHFIVKINFRYYDPSYGAGPFEGTTDEANLIWEQGAMHGYWGIANSNGPYLGVRLDTFDVLETWFNR